ncbi:MAG: hypothetical protein AAFV95_04100 [Bacteroidota bacterium]
MKTLQYTIFLSLLLAFCLMESCTKPPDYPDEPVITFERLSKNVIRQRAKDSLLMVFSFTDGDGDLGDAENSANVFLTDTRDGSSFITYSVPFVPVQGANNGISGEISVVLSAEFQICCIPPAGLRPCESYPQFPSDTLIYEIQLQDRAGNLSNVIQSAPIFLQCD